ncbi:MAG: teichoic acid biosynthesis protein [Sandaracinus sp.]|nr:teichoic acid biosynthesis protein [Sandaracinus sp.]|tara:strand:- start:65 stop:1162 length:1098 start_codon:yes stop_codon:yes gene_type:complete
MKILYGVTGEGMGHAIRSRVILEHLFAAGHQVEVVASNRAASFLSERFANVHHIHGLHIVSAENRVRKGKTLWSNVKEGLQALPSQVGAYFELIEDFAPEVVISDFESWSYLYGMAHDLPVISIDNQQVMNRCTLPDEVLDGARAEFAVVKAFVKAKLPWCAHYLIATFFQPPIRKKRTTLHPPILRPEILAAEPTPGDHLLVYQTSTDNRPLLEVLRKSGRECHIYGMERSLKEDRRDGNLVHKPFSEQGFIDDLASSAGVIASAGFTLMGEAVHLKKPMIAIPLEGQFEQRLNARYLAYLGYGAAVEGKLDSETLARFFDSIPAYRAALEEYEHDGNVGLFAQIDTLLDQVAAGVLTGRRIPV